LIWELSALISLALAAYVLGSVPTAYLVVRATKGRDICELGSHNVGALNAYRTVGAWAGLTVLLVNMGKGILAVVVPRLFGVDDWVLFVTTPLVVAGHNWPVFLNFRGGKGAAAIFGISLVIVPWLTVITAGPSLLVMILLRNVVLARLSASSCSTRCCGSPGRAPSNWDSACCSRSWSQPPTC
jgi:glycerol-3-phosphate acyltransferase PlsY